MRIAELAPVLQSIFSDNEITEIIRTENNSFNFLFDGNNVYWSVEVLEGETAFIIKSRTLTHGVYKITGEKIA